MRCDVINIMELKTVASNHENTDIEIWREGSSYSKALVASGPRDVAKYVIKNGNFVPVQKVDRGKSGKRCQKAETPEAANMKGKNTFVLKIIEFADVFFRKQLIE